MEEPGASRYFRRKLPGKRRKEEPGWLTQKSGTTSLHLLVSVKLCFSGRLELLEIPIVFAANCKACWFHARRHDDPQPATCVAYRQIELPIMLTPKSVVCERKLAFSSP
jgi:hypothetical protein